jgi:hypothetical protein
VFSVTLDHFVSHYGHCPGLIKIDVEGGELDLLKGGAEYLRERHPILLLSTHGESLKNECLSLLRDYSYANCRPLNNSTIESAQEFLISR